MSPQTCSNVCFDLPLKCGIISSEEAAEQQRAGKVKRGWTTAAMFSVTLVTDAFNRRAGSYLHHNNSGERTVES